MHIRPKTLSKTREDQRKKEVNPTLKPSRTTPVGNGFSTTLYINILGIFLANSRGMIQSKTTSSIRTAIKRHPNTKIVPLISSSMA